MVWRKGIAELRASKKYEITQKGQVLQLTINNLEKSDSDTYTCDIGDAQSRAKLVVQGRHERNVVVRPVSPSGNIICVGRSISKHRGSRSTDFWLCLTHEGHADKNIATWSWTGRAVCRCEAITPGVLWV